MQPIQFFAARAEDGALVPGAAVDVFVTGTQTRAALFADSLGSVPLGNPAQADNNARVFFYSAITRVDIRIHRGAYVGPLMRDVVITDPDDVLALTNGLYRTIAQGMAATANGKTFQVIAPEDEAAFAIYVNVGGAAVDTGKRIPTRYLLDKVQAASQLYADAARTFAEGAAAYAGRNFGPLVADPETNPLGQPLSPGDRYFNTVDDVERVYTGDTWYTPNADGQAIQRDLGNSTDPGKGARMVGYTPGYPGPGFEGGDVGKVLDEKVAITRFGVKPGLSGNTNSIKAQMALERTANEGFTLEIPNGEYDFAGPLYVDHTLVSDSAGVDIVGLGSMRNNKIKYSGPGHWLSVTGQGKEDDSPITRFKMRNFWIYGGDNVLSDGGIYIDRCYIVRVEDVSSSGWGKVGAHAAEFRNVFNFELSGGNYANGFPGSSGDAVVVVGSKNSGNGDEWNTSNVTLRNTLLQHGMYGLKVEHDGNIFDNLTLDNVSFGKNALWNVYTDTPNINNIGIRQGHFESPGYNGSSVPNAGSGHIKIHRATCVDIGTVSFQDALTYFDFDSVRAFDIGRGNKYFETGYYALAGSTLLKIRTTYGNCIGAWGENEIRFDQIDKPFDFVETAPYRIDVARRARTKVVESFWDSEIYMNPKAYQGTVINRYQSANAPFDQMITDGASWYRSMISSMYKGERIGIPTTNENQGSFYLNKNGTLQGEPGAKYIVFGWYSLGGGSWQPMRFLTGG
ncbi:hypothetical protein D3C84_353700 [compost metagenome]